MIIGIYHPVSNVETILMIENQHDEVVIALNAIYKSLSPKNVLMRSVFWSKFGYKFQDTWCFTFTFFIISWEFKVHVFNVSGTNPWAIGQYVVIPCSVMIAHWIWHFWKTFRISDFGRTNSDWQNVKLVPNSKLSCVIQLISHSPPLLWTLFVSCKFVCKLLKTHLSRNEYLQKIMTSNRLS